MGFEYMNIVTPFDPAIQTLGTVPVMIARGNEDSYRVYSLECGLQERSGIRSESIVFVQITSAKNSVRSDLNGEVHDSVECVAERLSSLSGSRGRRTCGCESAIEMKIGEVNERQSALPGLTIQSTRCNWWTAIDRDQCQGWTASHRPSTTRGNKSMKSAASRGDAQDPCRFESLGLSLIARDGAISDSDNMGLCRSSQQHQPHPIVRCLSMAGGRWTPHPSRRLPLVSHWRVPE